MRMYVVVVYGNSSKRPVNIAQPQITTFVVSARCCATYSELQFVIGEGREKLKNKRATNKCKAKGI